MTGDKLYLTHIEECIERIEQFTANDRSKFLHDVMVQDAVLRNLHTLSESSTRVSPEIQSRFTELPWKEMRAFRHVVVHDYLGLDVEQIWDIVENDIPNVKVGIRKILEALP